MYLLVLLLHLNLGYTNYGVAMDTLTTSSFVECHEKGQQWVTASKRVNTKIEKREYKCILWGGYNEN